MFRHRPILTTAGESERDSRRLEQEEARRVRLKGKVMTAMIHSLLNKPYGFCGRYTSTMFTYNDSDAETQSLSRRSSDRAPQCITCNTSSPGIQAVRGIR